jgi:HlyD family secretion protein
VWGSMRKLWWFILLAILLIAASGGWYMQSKGASVEAIRVSQADLMQYVQVTGKVKMKEERKFYAQTDGKLLHVYIKVGDTVKEKQVLAEIDLSEAQYKLQQLELQLEEMQADWNKMKEGPQPQELKILEENVHQGELKLASETRQLNYTRNDYDRGIATKTELLAKEDALNMAQSALVIAQNNLSLSQQGPSSSDTTKYNAKIKQIQLQQDQLNKDLLNMQIISNWSGTITDLPVQEGQVVARGWEMLTLSDPSQIEIVADVKEAFISQVFMNQEAVIKGTALGKEQFNAHVIKLAPTASASQSTQDTKPVRSVTLGLDKTSAKLVPGYNVDVNFVVSRVNSALQVPNGAIKENQDGTSYVWTVQGSKAVRMPVETGIKNDTAIEVKKGLEADSLVIVNVPDSLRDQQKITVVP